MSDVDDLVTWLRAQLDDDERAAKAWLPLGNPTAADREHIARHDPARVLRQVERDRRIIDLHDRDHECAVYVTHQGVTEVDNCAWVLKGDGCSTVRLLALPYADRPGYRDEWKP